MFAVRPELSSISESTLTSKVDTCVLRRVFSPSVAVRVAICWSFSSLSIFKTVREALIDSSSSVSLLIVVSFWFAASWIRDNVVATEVSCRLKLMFWRWRMESPKFHKKQQYSVISELHAMGFKGLKVMSWLLTKMHTGASLYVWRAVHHARLFKSARH